MPGGDEKRFRAGSSEKEEEEDGRSESEAATATTSSSGELQKLESRFEALEAGLKYIEDDLKDMKNENKDLRRRLAQAEGRVSRAEGMLKNANKKIISLTTRSMKNNIVIKNLPEEKSEDLRASLHFLFKDVLGIKEEVVIENAHRAGKPLKDRHRIIIVELNTQGKRTVMTNLKHIKHISQEAFKNIKITDQYPCEIRERRTKLWSCMMTAKEEGKTARLKKDKLLIDNRIVESTHDAVTDLNLDLSGRALELKPKHATRRTHEGKHIQGHLIPISTKDDITPALIALCADQSIACASTTMYAYRIGNKDRYISNYEDNGEFGAGRAIMKSLDEQNSFGHLVIVTSWNPGRSIRRIRPADIQRAALEALALNNKPA